MSTTVDRPDHVVVVGGGITGLTAAYRLSQGGVHVTVIEPDRLGGKLQTSLVAGRPVDETADAFLLRVPWALALCHDLEIDGELISPAERTAHLYLDGHRRPMPTGHVMGVPTDLRALAASGIVSAAAVERASADLTDPADPADPGVSGADTAIGPYLRRRLGDEVVDRLIDPLLGGINAGDTATMSLAAVVPQLDAAARSGDPSLIEACRAQIERGRAGGADPDRPIFAAPVGGMVRLPQAIAHAARMTGNVELRLGTALSALGRGGMVNLSDGTTIAADAVIVATSGLTAAEIVGSVSPDARGLLAGVPHVSVAFVRVAVRPSDLGRPLDGSGVLVPRTEGRVVTACSWASQKWEHLGAGRGDGTEVVRAAVGRDGDQAVLELDDAALVERVVDDLGPLLDLRAAPTATSVHRYPRAFPQYRPGHLDRVTAMEAALGRDAPEVEVAGMHLRGVGIPAAVASGEAAADRVLVRSRPR
jgi:oxygen-dependent protoporphyrinogen oxidase